ncbi:MAG: transcriptional regulator, partial [Olsenella sp.]|nr:transcriptional regulator [Olsenella sp.]
QMKAIRVRLGLSQRDAAELTNMPVRRYGSYERGERNLTLGEARVIAKAFHCSIDELAGRWECVGTRADLSQHRPNEDFTSMDEPKHGFYETLAMVLEERGMTISAACDKTGMYTSYSSKLKSANSKDITWEKALAIIESLGMTPDEFYLLQHDDKHDDLQREMCPPQKENTLELKLGALRKRSGLSQKQMAEKLGVKLRTYGSWERGEVSMSVSQLVECARVLDCSTDEILGMELKIAFSNPREAELHRVWRGLDRERQDRLMSDAHDMELAALMATTCAQDERAREGMLESNSDTCMNPDIW